jgi:DNA modification methylase
VQQGLKDAEEIGEAVTPFYDEDGISIYHGKAEVVLPTLPRAGLLLTDPPYGIGESSKKHVARCIPNRLNGARGSKAFQVKYERTEWDDSPPPAWLLQQAVAQCDEAIVFGGNYFGLAASSCWLVWDKDNGSSDFADCELAWTNLPKAVRRLKFRWAGMLQEYGGAAKEPRFHPTQKPLPVMRWAITHSTPDGSTILDPFCGSGTTLVAAKLEGRPAIGIEINERYCEIAANRLRQGVLFGAETAK